MNTSPLCPTSSVPGQADDNFLTRILLAKRDSAVATASGQRGVGIEEPLSSRVASNSLSTCSFFMHQPKRDASCRPVEIDQQDTFAPGMRVRPSFFSSFIEGEVIDEIGKAGWVERRGEVPGCCTQKSVYLWIHRGGYLLLGWSKDFSQKVHGKKGDIPGHVVADTRDVQAAGIAQEVAPPRSWHGSGAPRPARRGLGSGTTDSPWPSPVILYSSALPSSHRLHRRNQGYQPAESPDSCQEDPCC